MRGSIVVQSTLLCLSFFVTSFITAFGSPPTTRLCLPDQRDALLEFKHLFHIQKQSFYYDPYLEEGVACDPKTDSWGNNNNTDCCSWEGVTCHPKSGVVIGLDLSNSCLSGRFHSNSSLFIRLPHLQKLNLAFNRFSYSPIPSELGKLVGLTHLNLSYSYFSGEVPTELLHLTKLVSLDLSSPYYSLQSSEKQFLSKLAQNLTHLEDLHLDGLYISSAIPQNLLNLSSLTSLSLDYCRLTGEFPTSILRMPSIRSVTLSGNSDLRGHLPEFYGDSSLVTLDLSHTSFSGGIPESIGNLNHLRALSLGSCNFSGRIPSSIGNLSYLTTLDLSHNNFLGEILSSIGNLSYLTTLDLSFNEFSGGIPSSIFNLNRLTTLGVSGNKLSGSFPLGILNLTKLSHIHLSDNEFTGSFPPNMTSLSNLERFNASGNRFVGAFPSSLLEIPSLTGICLNRNQLNEFGNIPPTSGLEYLSVGDNSFRGPIPMASISKLVNLQVLVLSRWNTGGNALDVSPLYHLKSLVYLDLSDLKMTTALDLSLFSPLQRLGRLDISGNHVSTTNITSASDFSQQLEELYMSGCNITEFPLFIGTQRDLYWLDLSNNMIKGQVPDWLWMLPMLKSLNISHNFLSSFQASSSQQMFPQSQLWIIDVSWNDFQGPLFIPPSQRLLLLSGSNNNFSGGIPQSICASGYLRLLDLSHNNLDGSVPLCLGNAIGYLTVLSLRHNQLSGTLPDIFVDAKELRSIDVSGNRLEGKLPKSLINCSSLEVLNVESNRIKDTFPFWLTSLQDLQVLVLRSNEFYGPIYRPQIAFGFPKLRIIDISHNHFNGSLPSVYFSNWTAMSSVAASEDSSGYMGLENGYYSDSVVLMNKGLEMEFVRILKILTAIDFSGNRFRGRIPESVGLLKELHVLNFSSNEFTGQIPSSLSNLTQLESLDLSQNVLSGRIPAELGDLSFLAYMNFSCNRLVGPIPQGTQFQSQPNSSFEHNLGLCGAPLDQGCGQVKTPSSHTNNASEPEDDENEGILSWIAVAIGFAPGLLFGVTMGHIVFSWKRQWLVKIFDRSKRRGTTRTR